MKRASSILFVIAVAQLGLGCSSGSSGSPGAAGSGGGAGTTGGAGSTGAAGTTGGAGTTGAAGTGAAGMGAAGTGAAGTGAGGTGAAGTGAAGTGAAGAGAAGAGAAGTGTAGTGAAGTGAAGTGAGGAAAMTFFVTSDTSMTGDLGGLTGADKRCQDLAVTAGAGGRIWHAYLSTATVNAKDRIGAGPWRNSKGALVANNLTELHAATKFGDHLLFIDEKGQPIPGQWTGSPAGQGVQHDIFTGSNADGTLKPNETCKDWTSAAATDTAWVGHSDGLGPGGSNDMMYRSWNSTHENGNCMNTAPKGGKGRLYCFATN